MKEYYVYKHIFPNGKVHIGITSIKPEYRWNNGNGYLNKKKDGTYSQPLMARAVIKYGWENIGHEILFSGLTKEEAEIKEQELITEYKSDNPKFGYNIEKGGHANKVSEETKKKMSNSHQGEKSFWYGKEFTEEHKRKLSESHKGTISTQRKPVLCIETGVIYSSVAEASEKTGINRKHISAVCNNKGRKTAGGYHWEHYIEENEVA